MKKILKIGLAVVIVLIAVAAWIFLGSATGFSASKEYLYIRSDAATKKAVLDSLEKNEIITNQTAFEFLAARMNYWQNIKPGKYEVKKGASLLTIVRMLRKVREQHDRRAIRHRRDANQGRKGVSALTFGRERTEERLPQDETGVGLGRLKIVFGHRNYGENVIL